MSTIRSCQKCGKTLSATSRSKGTCSDCYKASRAKQPIICSHCGDSFVPVKKGKFCSLDCFNAFRISSARAGAAPAPISGARWVPLTQGKFALVDECDADHILTFTWCAVKVRPNARGDVFYAKNVRTGEYLHRFLLGIDDSSTEVDHHDGDGLNCRRDNLRRTDKAGNGANRLVTFGKYSGYKGVHKTASGQWVVRYTRRGRNFYGGTFMDKEEAAKEYDKIARQYGGPISTFNFPNPDERSAIQGQILYSSIPKSCKVLVEQALDISSVLIKSLDPDTRSEVTGIQWGLYAPTGRMLLSKSDCSLLISAGATEWGKEQKIRIATDQSPPSIPCAYCHSLIFCGQHGETKGVCYCGKRYELIFDGSPRNYLLYDPRCMWCGKSISLELSPPSWVELNPRQWTCQIHSWGTKKDIPQYPFSGINMPRLSEWIMALNKGELNSSKSKLYDV